MEVRGPIVAQIRTAVEQDAAAPAGSAGKAAPAETLLVLSAPDTVPARGAMPEKVADRLSGTDAAPALAGDLAQLADLRGKLTSSFGGESFDIVALLKLMVDTGAGARKANAEQRRALLDASIAKSEQAVQELRSAAVSRLVGGIIGGITQVAGGALTTTGGLKALKTPGMDSQSINNKFMGLGTAVQGFGQIAAAGANAAADMQQAASQGYDIQAKQMDKLYEENKELNEALKELVQHTLSAVKEWEGALKESSSRIINA